MRSFVITAVFASVAINVLGAAIKSKLAKCNLTDNNTCSYGFSCYNNEVCSRYQTCHTNDDCFNAFGQTAHTECDKTTPDVWGTDAFVCKALGPPLPSPVMSYPNSSTTCGWIAKGQRFKINLGNTDYTPALDWSLFRKYGQPWSFDRSDLYAGKQLQGANIEDLYVFASPRSVAWDFYLDDQCGLVKAASGKIIARLGDRTSYFINPAYLSETYTKVTLKVDEQGILNFDSNEFKWNVKGRLPSNSPPQFSLEWVAGSYGQGNTRPKVVPV